MSAFLPGAACAQTSDAPTADTLTDEHVRRAIDAIVDELYARQDARHYWDPAPWNDGKHGSATQRGGYTALTVLALLYAGESYQDPRLRSAVEHLARTKLGGTYAVAVRASVWAKLPPKFETPLAEDTRWLLDGFSETAGGWTYEQKPKTTRRDNSIRQYGALALWEAAKRGVLVDRRYWKQLEAAFIDCQHAEGGWNYKGDAEPPTGSMTAAGLATLFITQDLLHAGAAVKLGGAESPRDPARNQAAIERGLAWMNEQFSPTENPGSFRDFYYYLYGVERVGLASGVKHFGGHDWYREGAAEMIRRLCAWDDASRTMTVHERVAGLGSGARVKVHELAFGLMFLSRGRVPVAINKLRIDGHPWNNRPRDVANLTRWIATATETDLAWQIVGLDAEPEAWLDAPLLYLASNRALPWLAEIDVDATRYRQLVREFRHARANGEIPVDSTPPTPPESEVLDRLRRYLDLGGLLFAVNEGVGSVFTISVKQLGTLMYPQHDWRPLPDDHWIYTIYAPAPGGKPGFVALTNGVRELMILCPSGDLAATFQGGTNAATPAEAPAEFRTAANLFFYASELNRGRPRLARHVHAPDAFVRARRTVSLVRAMHGGNWKPEPAALEIFRSAFAERHGIELRIVDRPLQDVHTLQPRPALVVCSGVEPHEFTPAERQAVLAYATGGGTLLFETTGGRGAFTLSAEQMAAELLARPIRSVRREPVITGRGIAGAVPLTRVEYRPYAFEVFGARETTPRLRGMKIDGAVRVLFSREDLGHALLDQPTWGISGYAPAAARDVLGNIVLYAIAGERRD